MEICKQQNEFELRHLSAVDRLKRGRGRFFNQIGSDETFFDQSTGIDKTNTFQLKFFIWHKFVGVTGFCGLVKVGVQTFF